MAKKRTIDDSVLGKMKEEFEGAWEGEVKAPGFEKPWRVYVNVDEEEGDEVIPKARRAALQKFFKTPDLRGRVQKWLLEYYEKVVEGNIREQMSPKEAALQAPVLERPEQIWELVSSLTVTVPADDEEADVKVSGNCEWDEEHGFEFDVRGGKVVWSW